MDTLLPILLVVVVFLTGVTVVGHLIWLMLAAIFRAVSPTPSEDAGPLCPNCSQRISRSTGRCPSCHPEGATPRDAELSDLAAIERQVRRWTANGFMAPDAAEEIRAQVRSYRSHLTGAPEVPAPSQAARPATAPATPAAAPRPAAAGPSPFVEIERLLLQADHLTAAQRGRAVSLSIELGDVKLAALSPAHRFSLARILGQEGKITEALAAYQFLVTRYCDHPGCAPTAVEAARLAVEHGLSQEARRFLDQVRAYRLSPAMQREAEELFRRAADTPEAQPAPGPVVAQAAPAPAAPVDRKPAAPKPAAPMPTPAAAAPAPKPPAPVPKAPPVEVPVPPAPPRKSFAELLSAFLEERNIRWGELVGGLLIVGCSIALVVSLRKQLEQIPYFQFFIFGGVTSALFGVGLYTQHRWKLESTSRGVLIISTLLVPLNFLAMASLAKGGWDGFAVLTQVLSLGIFGFLIQRSGRVLVPNSSWLLTLAVLGSSIAVPLTSALVPGFIDPGVSAWPFILLACLPVACHVATTGTTVRQFARRETLVPSQAGAIFAFLGMATFALAVAMGLLISRGGDQSVTLDRLAALVALAAMPVAAGGLVVMRRMGGEATLEAFRTAGMTIALLAMAVMLAALGLAWPEPAGIILVGALDFAAITAIAFRYRLPAAHILGVACLAVTYLTAAHTVLEATSLLVPLGPPPVTLPGIELLQWAVSAQCGTSLVGLFLLMGIASEVMARRGLRDHAEFYVGGCGIVAVIGLVLVTFRGYDDPVRAALVWGIYGAGAAVGAFTRGDARLLAAAQGLLGVAITFAVTAWLKDCPWGWADPRTLQAYGIGLASVCLASCVARTALIANLDAKEVLNPPWPAVDRVLLIGLIAGQTVLAVVCILPAVFEELFGGPSNVASSLYAFGYGPGAWALLAMLAASLATAVWSRWEEGEMLGSLTLVATVPLLVAGRFAPELAAASATRWALAIGFVAVSAVVWLRSTLLERIRAAGGRIDVSEQAPARARRFLLVAMVAPVLVLTGMVAMLGFAGQSLAGPAPGSFFFRLGWVVANVVPLVLVAVGLVGYAVRERSPGYAFAGGLVANATIMGGYALGIVTGGGTIGVPECVFMIQLGTITAGLWAAAWMLSRPWVYAWREGDETSLATGLMNVQLLMGALGNVVLLLAALAFLAIYQPHPDAILWTREVGSLLGWLALAVPAAAAVLRAVQVSFRPRPDTVGLVGMAVLGLVACSVERFWPDLGWGYRSLMLGWAMYSLLVVAATWWVATIRTLPGDEGPPQDLLRAAAIWVRIAGTLAVLLGLKAAFWYDEQLWAAAAIALPSIAGAAMAVWHRREEWAFAAGLGVNLAASLVVWHYLRLSVPVTLWWIELVQANTIASAAVAILWLAAMRRLYGDREIRLATCPWLALQVSLGAAGNVFLLSLAAAWLFIAPAADFPAWLLQGGRIPGWLALGLAAVAGGWYLVEAAPRKLLHALCGAGIGFGTLAACAVAAQDPGDWRAYHVLTTAWTAVGLAVLALGVCGVELRLPWSRRSNNGPAHDSGWAIGEGRLVQGWVTLIGTLVVMLALRGAWDDPGAPYWSACAAAVVSLMAGVLAMWRGQSAYVAVSGLLWNVAATILWLAWGQPLTTAGFLQTNALACGAASIFWSAVGFALPGSVPGTRMGDRSVPLAWTAAQAALVLVAILAAAGVIADGAGESLAQFGPLDSSLGWIAFGVTAAALVVCLWTPEAELVLLALYVAGLAGIALGLHHQQLEPRRFGWIAAAILAGYVLSTALVAWLAPRARRLWEALGWPPAESRRTGWVGPFEALLAVTTAWLGIWIPLEFNMAGDVLADRLIGPLAVGLLLPAAVALAARAGESLETVWRYAALAIAGLVAVDLGWALLDPGCPAPWLHRNVILMVALAAMTPVCGFGLVRLLPSRGAWAESSRRIALVFGAGSLATLFVVLGQEASLYNPATDAGAPMAMPAIVVVAVALVGLAAAAIAFAVLPNRDPLHLSERGRTLYVYTAEVLLVLLAVHLRLTKPELFHLGLIRKYWTLLVMAAAFGGAGLSEFFRRLRTPVLAEPLARTAALLPMLPVFGYWGLAKVLPVGAVEYSALHYSGILFLVGLFYGFLATTKRSLGFAVLAVLAANTGLWVLWNHWEIAFLEHPQVWLIPVALVALVAEHLNRGRLTDYQSETFRYIALSVIYVSSTADMFIAGVGNALYLPLVLMVLSVLGVLAGILLRVRAFLFLGVTFLILVIVTMIWYAAVDLGHTWIWYASGIALGVAIITLFAVFEKRRNELLSAIERLKQWK